MANDPKFEVAFGSKQFDPLAEQANADFNDDDPGIQAWFVQVKEPLGPDDRGRLQREFGLRLSEFVPKLTYVERLLTATAKDLQADPLVRAVAPYTSEVKVAPTAGQSKDDDGSSLLLVALFDDSESDAVVAELMSLGAFDVAVLDSRAVGGSLILRFALPFGKIEAVSTIGDVRWIESVPEVVDNQTPVVPLEAERSGTAGMISLIWDAGLHGEGQTIGVLDNGEPDMKHCFFKDVADNKPRPGHRKVVALRNAVGGDPHAHATFVAGCAVGDDFHQPGNARSRGGAWAAMLVVGNRKDLALANPDPATATSLLDELAAAAAAGATIHSNSWHAKPQGSRLPATYDLTCVDVDTFTWNEEEHLVLGASGNSGEEQGPPGVAKNAICVSAASANTPDAKLGDGSPGPTADGRRKPDLMMAGCGIHSAKLGTDCRTGPKQECASSYATPFAAAAAALVRQYFMEGHYPSGKPTPSAGLTPTGALVKAVLINAASASSGVTDYPSDSAGWGLVQLQRTLWFDGGLRRLRVWDVRNADGLITGGRSEHTIAVESDDEPLKVALVWTEPPGVIGAITNPVVNDLDLEVISPRGDVFLGNVFAEGRSVTGGAPDARNNVEAVLVNRPTKGDWKIVVKATAVHVGRPGQGFAVAVTGRLAARHT